MKIILNKSEQNTVHIDKINMNYLIVAIIDGVPCILRKGWKEKNERLVFASINYKFTLGAGHNFSNKLDNIHDMIVYAMEEHNAKVEAFHQDNWKEALQWLIDNAE